MQSLKDWRKIQNKLEPKAWIESEVTRRTLVMRESITISLLVIFTILCLGTISLFFLQGFHTVGFNLDTSLLLMIGGATIGEVAGLIGTAISYFSQVNR
jgi:hypothetical protein